jgi:hypothetical protein
MSSPAVLYRRVLPGGGYVAVDVRPVTGRAAGGAAEHLARLWVERRADPARRTGHAPPVIAEAAAAEPEQAMAELRAIAADNVALAAVMRRWARGVQPPSTPS